MSSDKPKLQVISSYEIGGAITNRVEEKRVRREPKPRVRRPRRDPLEGDSPVAFVLVSMTEDDKAALHTLCESLNIQISSYVRRALKAYKESGNHGKTS